MDTPVLISATPQFYLLFYAGKHLFCLQHMQYVILELKHVIADDVNDVVQSHEKHLHSQNIPCY